MSETEEQTANTAKQAPSSGVGALLKATRTRTGQDIRQVSQALRIRQPFLQAIEDGRYEDLPGPTYALGFVRSYSDFLGLDSEEVVRRFRAETSGAGLQKELIFPTPAAEKRLPSGALVAAALALGVVVYGGWYAVSSSQRPVAEAVPDVPDRLTEKGGEKTEEAKQDDTPPEPTTLAAAQQAQLAQAEEAKKAEADAAAKKAEADAAAKKAEADAAAKKAAEPAKIEGGKQLAGMAQTPIAPAATAQGMGGLAVAGQQQAAASPSPAAAPTEEQRPPRVYGQTEGDVRLVIKATNDSWIQVRDEKGNLVATRLLKKGDSYRVPNGPGKLSLTTGDAGALSATVDGMLVTPSLGPSGSVRRDIVLDPDRIKAGN